MTSAWHPQTNGSTERQHRTLGTILTALVAQSGSDVPDWDRHLDAAALVMRSSVHRSIKDTPHRVLFGCDPALPLDLLWRREGVVDGEDAHEYGVGLVERLQVVRAAAVAAQEEAFSISGAGGETQRQPRECGVLAGLLGASVSGQN